MDPDLRRDAEHLTQWLEGGTLQAGLVRRMVTALDAADVATAACEQWERQARTLLDLLREGGRDTTLTDFSFRVLVLALVDPVPITAVDLTRTIARYPHLFRREPPDGSQ